jgi:peptide-methionine (S)-S-oxide reductase
MLKSLLPAAAITLVAIGTLSVPGHAEKAVVIPPVARDVTPQDGPATAVFAGGCFWGMEAVFEGVKGVRRVVNGYAGGTRATATYDQVSSERTRHAEAIRITYDPAQISYGQLLRVFFSVAHDPTQVDGQYPDSGTSYRSAIFPTTPEQRAVAAAYIAQLDKVRAYRKPIATRLEGGQFFPAEAHHQDFARRNPAHPYITRWDKPKVVAFRAAFPGLAR